MSESRKTLFTQKVGRLFIDVFESANGRQYLALTEARNINGVWTKQRLNIFPDQLTEWEKALQEAIRCVTQPAEFPVSENS